MCIYIYILLYYIYIYIIIYIKLYIYIYILWNLILPIHEHGWTWYSELSSARHASLPRVYGGQLLPSTPVCEGDIYIPTWELYELYSNDISHIHIYIYDILCISNILYLKPLAIWHCLEGQDCMLSSVLLQTQTTSYLYPLYPVGHPEFWKSLWSPPRNNTCLKALSFLWQHCKLIPAICHCSNLLSGTLTGHGKSVMFTLETMVMLSSHVCQRVHTIRIMVGGNGFGFKNGIQTRFGCNKRGCPNHSVLC